MYAHAARMHQLQRDWHAAMGAMQACCQPPQGSHLWSGCMRPMRLGGLQAVQLQLSGSSHWSVSSSMHVPPPVQLPTISHASLVAVVTGAVGAVTPWTPSYRSTCCCSPSCAFACMGQWWLSGKLPAVQ